MPRLRQMSGREVVAALGRHGFAVLSQRGDHAKLVRRAPDGGRQVMTVPLHDELAAGTLRAIARQAEHFIGTQAVREIFFS